MARRQQYPGPDRLPFSRRGGHGVCAGISACRLPRQVGAERPAIEDQTDPRDFLSTLLPISSDHLLIQYSRASRRQIADPMIRTYLVDAATGLGAFVGTDLPVISAVLSDGYVAVFDDPHPRVEVRKLATRPTAATP